ncbi:MAG TPA: methyltransferase domain-containing protein [Solirubrobacteraceae bacterium]|jgi:SAM-dependent methyltransferase
MNEHDYDDLSQGVWEGVSGGWRAHAAEMEESAHGEAATRMLDAAQLLPGERVLELACGPAGVGLRAAAAVGPDGSVLLTDFSQGMVQAARDRASELGVTNVDFAVADAQDLALPDESFDAVLCRFGYMLMGDPFAAMSETARVLRRGGRVALAVWGEPADNAWIMLTMRVVMEHVSAPPPDLDAPGLWAFRDHDRLRGMLGNAGLAGVKVETLNTAERFSSLDEAWQYLSDIAGPLQALLASLSAEDLVTVRERLADETAPFTAADGSLELPAAINIAVATRPGP